MDHDDERSPSQKIKNYRRSQGGKKAWRKYRAKIQTGIDRNQRLEVSSAKQLADFIKREYGDRGD